MVEYFALRQFGKVELSHSEITSKSAGNSKNANMPIYFMFC
jgi:hypothetical protein